MKESEGSTGSGFERLQVAANRLEQGEGAGEVSSHELAGAVDAAVHVTLGGEVHDGAGMVDRQQPVDQAPVANVAPHEHVPGIAVEAAEIFEVAGVGERVEVHYRLLRAREPVEHEVTADEAGAAGH